MERIKVLHIEDDDGDAHLIRHALSNDANFRFEIVREERMANALKYMDGNSVDVILVDLSLPDSSGLDSVIRLRTFAPDQAIVVITGLDDQSLALDAVKNGAQDYLIKNELNSSAVARAIRYALERHKYDAQVMKLANFDRLTGLANRSRCQDYLEHALENAKRLKKSLSVLFIDCDHFKLVNDTLGHSVGDDFLKKMSKAINDCLRASDFIARLGGDEFVVVLDHEDDPLRSSIVVAEKILKSVRRGIELDGGEWVNARCSIGVAGYSGYDNPPTVEQLIHEADTAMYSAKRKGGDRVRFFDGELEKQASRRIELLRGITQAFSNSEFGIVYQPILNVGTGVFEGIEALLRWNTAAGEVVSPEEFIPLLEETGMIRVIGSWVIEQACRDFAILSRESVLPESAWVSVNISPVQFNDFNFVDRIKEVIATAGLKPRQLQFEITESLVLEQRHRTIDVIGELKAAGVQLALDDFGVGYSSMNYLKKLPLDKMKIDKAFVLRCVDVQADRAITRAMIALAHNLDIQVIAEGVENQAVSRQLIGDASDYLQGFYHSKPMGLDELRAFYDGSHKAAISQAL